MAWLRAQGARIWILWKELWNPLEIRFHSPLSFASLPLFFWHLRQFKDYEFNNFGWFSAFETKWIGFVDFSTEKWERERLPWSVLLHRVESWQMSYDSHWMSRSIAAQRRAAAMTREKLYESRPNTTTHSLSPSLRWRVECNEKLTRALKEGLKWSAAHQLFERSRPSQLA